MMKVLGSRPEAESLFGNVFLEVAQRRQEASLGEMIGPRLEYCPHEPHPPQRRFIELDDLEVLYGGAAGGGKSDAMLMAALQYVHIPGYAALLLRRTFPDLTQPGALMDRANDWLRPSDARMSRGRVWVFPSGARILFGYLQHENDKYQYQSSEFQFIGFDELTQFSETQYTYLFSRLRRPDSNATDSLLAKVPLRMRSASNPGGVGHDWVRRRFPVMPGDNRTEPVFIAAKLQDNPSVDEESYVESLMHLDPITRAQLMEGNWEARATGGYFHREDFRIVEKAPIVDIQWVRYWDLASTPVGPNNPDPDWTAGARVGVTPDGIWYIGDVARLRESPGTVRRFVQTTAEMDTVGTEIVIEEEGGASGKDLIYNYRKELAGFQFRGLRSSGSKEVRATIVANEVEAGNVRLLRGEWNNSLINEAEAFPTGSHDDQVDAISGAFAALKNAFGSSESYSGITGTPDVIMPVAGSSDWDPWLEEDS